MGIFQQSIAGFSSLFATKPTMNHLNPELVKLAAGQSSNPSKKVLPWKSVAVSNTQKDIKTWKDGETAAQLEEPKNFQLQLVLTEIANDALLTSQIENRNNQIYSVGYSLKNANGEIDEEQTDKLKKLSIFRKITNAVLMARYYGYSLIELNTTIDRNGNVVLLQDLIPRTNVVPQTGKFYPDYTDDKNIDYRTIAEFGKTVLEFYDGEFGLLNKIVPFVMFKKFAFSCWSELCEIYGIPPRFMKTNTADPAMLARSEQMMRDMGSAAWFIIDQDESFEFAKGVSTTGDVYSNLIDQCNNEISMLISGAIIGQDTKNGSNAKEQSSQDLLTSLVNADIEIVEEKWNTIVIPALVELGLLSGELTLEFDPIEDVSELWTRTKDVLQYMDVDLDWFKTKFGIEVTGMKQTNTTTLGIDPNFFG